MPAAINWAEPMSTVGAETYTVRDGSPSTGARLPIHIDIGYGDAITPGVLDIEYPSLLGMPTPRLKAYPPETVLAEKFQAMMALGIANSRMKDFFDVWAIANTFAFEGAVLAKAIAATFRLCPRACAT